MAKAVQSRDIEGILAAYAEDVVFYGVRDSLEGGKERLRESWEECFASWKDFKIEINEPAIESTETWHSGTA